VTALFFHIIPNYTPHQDQVYKHHAAGGSVVLEGFGATSASKNVKRTVTGRGYIGKDLEGSGCDLFEVLLRNFPGGTVENHGKR